MKLAKNLPNINFNYEFNTLTQAELKAIMLLYHYPHLKLECEQNTKKWQDEFKFRKFIETQINDCYDTVSTVVFSNNGSPPKGIAVLLKTSYTDGYIGTMFLIGNARKSREFQVMIK